MPLPRPVLWAAILVLVSSCGELQATSEAPPDARPAVAVYLVAHDRHTGLVVPRTEIPAGLWPESRDFPRAEYLEIGWGERDYYQGLNRGVWGTLKAGMLATPSVLHVVGIRGPVARYFQASEVVELMLPRDGFDHLIHYIDGAHERTGVVAATALGSGLYGNSRFYPAWESFHVFHNCNVWTARALRAGGLPIRDSITRAGLMPQARAIGKVLNEP